MRIKFSVWLVFLATLILPANLFAGTLISGYGGSRWKDTPAQVKATLIGKEFKIDEGGKVISYKDKMLDENVKIKYIFEQDALIMVTVDLLLPSSNLAEFLRVYQKFMAYCAEMYGQPVKVVKKGVTDVDNDNLILLAAGGGYYLNIWGKGEGWLEMRIAQGDYGPGLKLTYMYMAQTQKKSAARTTETVAEAEASPSTVVGAGASPAPTGFAPRSSTGITFGVRPSLYWLPKAGDFKVTKADNSKSVEVAGKTTIGLSPYVQMQIAPELAAELALDGFWGKGTRLLVGSASLIAMTKIREDIKPYLKLGVYYGQFAWDEVGSFNGGLGFQFGAGVEKKLNEHWGISLDITGRSLKNKFNSPSGWKAESDAIDLSGILISGGVFYQF